MASGVFHSYTFTAAASGKAVVQCTYEAQATAADFGAAVSVALRETHSSSTTTLETNNPGSTRQRSTLVGSFNVTAGVSYTVDLWGNCTGATAVTAWNIKLHIEVIKR